MTCSMLSGSLHSRTLLIKGDTIAWLWGALSVPWDLLHNTRAGQGSGFKGILGGGGEGGAFGSARQVEENWGGSASAISCE